MACELELDGVVAVLRTVVRDEEFEGFILDEPRVHDEIYAAVSGLVAEQFGRQIELSRKIEIERGSVVVLLTLVTVGRVIIEYGALMAGLRELSRLIPERIRRAITHRRRHPGPMHVEPTQVILGPTVLVAQRPNRAPISSTMTVALSAIGGATLIVAGVLLGHFL